MILPKSLDRHDANVTSGYLHHDANERTFSSMYVGESFGRA